MKKIILAFIFSIFLLFNAGKNTSADFDVVEPSATLLITAYKTDYRTEKLKHFFNQYNSPLSEYSEVFIYEADRNNLDWRLIPAITGVESTYGKFIPYNSYNAYGWNNGNYSFKSWEDSIHIVANTLRDKYIQRGYVSINQIARIYAPPSSTWANKVKFIMNKIDVLPLEYSI